MGLEGGGRGGGGVVFALQRTGSQLTYDGARLVGLNASEGSVEEGPDKDER